MATSRSFMVPLAWMAVAFLWLECPTCAGQQLPQSAEIAVTPADLVLPHSLTSRGGNVTVRCTGAPGNAANLYSLKLSRVLQSNPNATPTALLHLQHHHLSPQVLYPIAGSSAYGSINQNFLTLRMTRAKCEDAAVYICQAAYLNAALAEFYDNDTLTVTVNPGQLTIASEPTFDHWAINNTVTLTCAGPLGTTDSETKLVWHWEFWDADVQTWRKYDGPSNDITTHQTNQLPCYSNGSTTLTRRLQLADSQRAYRCYAQLDGVSATNFAGRFQFGYVMQTTDVVNDQYQYGLELGAGIGVASAAAFFALILLIVLICLCKRGVLCSDTGTADSIRKVPPNSVVPKGRSRSVGVQVDIPDDDADDDSSYDYVDNSLPVTAAAVVRNTMAFRPSPRSAPPMSLGTPRDEAGNVYDEGMNVGTAKQLQAAAEDVLHTLLTTRQVTSWKVSGEGGPTSFILNLSPANHPDVTYLGTQLQQGRWHKKRPGAAQQVHPQQQQEEHHHQHHHHHHGHGQEKQKRSKHQRKGHQRLALTENLSPHYESPRRYKDTRILF